MPKINIPQSQTQFNEPSVGRVDVNSLANAGAGTVELANKLESINQHFKKVRDFRDESLASISIKKGFDLVAQNQLKDDNPDNLDTYVQNIDQIKGDAVNQITNPVKRAEVAYKFETLAMNAKANLLETSRRQYKRQAEGSFYQSVANYSELAKTSTNEQLEINAIDFENEITNAVNSGIITPSEGFSIKKTYKDVWKKSRNEEFEKQIYSVIKNDPLTAIDILDSEEAENSIDFKKLVSLKKVARQELNYKRKVVIDEINSLNIEGKATVYDVEKNINILGETQAITLIKRIEKSQINRLNSNIEELGIKDASNVVDYLKIVQDTISSRGDRFAAREKLANMIADGNIDDEEAKSINSFINSVSGDKAKKNKWQENIEKAKQVLSAMPAGYPIRLVTSELLKQMFKNPDNVEKVTEESLKTEYNKAFPQAPLGENDKLIDPKREREFVHTPFLERVAKGYGIGVAGMVTGVGGALDFLGADEVGKAVMDYADMMSDTYQIPDPDFTYALSGGIASSSTFLLPGIGIARGVKIASAVPRLAQFMGVSASTMLESIIEAGAVKAEGIKRGYTDQESDKAATITFWTNIPTIAVSNMLGGLFDDNKAGLILKTLRASGFEGGQEFTQQMVTNFAMNDPIMQDAMQSAVIGAITGGGMSMATSLSDVVGELETNSSLLEKLKSKSGQARVFPDGKDSNNKTNENKVEQPKQQLSDREKVHGLSLSMESRTVQEGLIEQFGDLPTYQTRDMIKVSEQVSELINTDYEKAKRIAFMEEKESGDLRAEEILVGLEIKAAMEGDVDLIHEMATNKKIVAHKTELGQRVKALDTRSDLPNPTKDLQNVIKIREKNQDIDSKERVQREELANSKKIIENKLEATEKQISETSDKVEAGRLKALKTRLKNNIKKVTQKLEDLDFTTAVRKGIDLDSEAIKLKSENERLRLLYGKAKKASELITKEEVAKMANASKEVYANKEKIDPKSEIGSKSRMDYGLSKVDYDDYVNHLISESQKIPLVDYLDPKNYKKGIVDLAGVMKSLVASFDNSVIGRQGLKVLIDDPKIWLKNSEKTYSDIVATFGGYNALRSMRAEVLSRPNALNGLYKQEKLAVGVREEMFPSSLPEKIPGLGKFFTASEAAFMGFAYRSRADIFDRLVDIAQTNGDTIEGIGKIANSLTGRGSIGSLEPIGGTLNNVFFSVRFVKSNIDALTAHAFGTEKNMGSFAKKQAATNSIKMIGAMAIFMAIVKAFDPDAIILDPRSSKFGKVLVGKNRDIGFDFTGGMAGLVTLTSRILSHSRLTLSGKEVKLNTGKYGASTAGDVLSQFTQNKLSPLAGMINDLYFRGTDFKGDKVEISKIPLKLIPIPISNYIEQKDNMTASEIISTLILDAHGISVSNYRSAKSKKNIKISDLVN